MQDIVGYACIDILFEMQYCLGDHILFLLIIYSFPYPVDLLILDIHFGHRADHRILFQEIILHLEENQPKRFCLMIFVLEELAFRADEAVSGALLIKAYNGALLLLMVRAR